MTPRSVGRTETSIQDMLRSLLLCREPIEKSTSNALGSLKVTNERPVIGDRQISNTDADSSSKVKAARLHALVECVKNVVDHSKHSSLRRVVGAIR